MGKVKRVRQKAHRASQKQSQQPASKDESDETNVEETQAFIKVIFIT